jgi:hypothetical protein
MRKILVAAFLVMGLGISTVEAGTAAGSNFGCLTTAQTQGMGKASLIPALGLADNATSVVGILSYGLSEFTDGRVKLALVDAKGPSDLKVAFGADFKWQFWNMKGVTAPPFDMAFGGLFEYIDYGASSLLQLGGMVIGSYPVEMANGNTLTPYGRFNLRVERLSMDKFGSDSDLEFGLNGGVAWAISNTMKLYGEFQLDGNDGVFFGLDFNIM